MTSRGTFRLLVTLITAASVPLCCCSLDVLYRVCGGRVDAASARCCTAKRGRPAHDHSAPLSHRDNHEGLASHSNHKPGQDGPERCACGADKKIGTSSSKLPVSFPSPVLAYVLPDPDFDTLRLNGLTAGIQPHSRGPLRPAQTLLYQHCALIV